MREKELRQVVLSKEEESLVLCQLHSVLRPFLLRRTKSQVLSHLPRKQERLLACPLSAWQRRLYRLLEDLSRAHSPAPTYLLPPSSAPRLTTSNLLNQLRKVLGRRPLIFSQFTTSLDLIEDFFIHRGMPYCRLDGRTPADARAEIIAEFNCGRRASFMAFLITTRAGGVGLNLQAGADTVILFDSDWNPQSDAQAMARCHRIGQTEEVLVLRLVSGDNKCGRQLQDVRPLMRIKAD
ncbi:transcription regulatory protein [Nannochloropsis gaditana]|uniref:Transcription regulatory protein n=1 Tax=Nannochloropsis gaditana TaxID=72520 RepID=W7TXC5_9STRA|nr:transcription regulatory protein [Nannochloropsis gaditana]